MSWFNYFGVALLLLPFIAVLIYLAFRVGLNDFLIGVFVSLTTCIVIACWLVGSIYLITK
jgi:TRAP-type mannitol/chloroaromatic compound transport system permease small subunit